jgi:hypothetical protein
VAPAGSGNAWSEVSFQATGCMEGSFPAQSTEIPAIQGLPFAMAMPWTDPEGAQSPPGSTGSGSGVTWPRQMTGTGRSGATAGFQAQPACNTVGGVGLFPEHAGRRSARTVKVRGGGIRMPAA